MLIPAFPPNKPSADYVSELERGVNSPSTATTGYGFESGQMLILASEGLQWNMKPHIRLPAPDVLHSEQRSLLSAHSRLCPTVLVTWAAASKLRGARGLQRLLAPDASKCCSPGIPEARMDSNDSEWLLFNLWNVTAIHSTDMEEDKRGQEGCETVVQKG